jgi:bifunctional N-acetylglucosamine-1-phosphate-uridyltransferase/glucosamine-1-phosphate-acetyltransferase GlmU-like protein
LKNTVYAIGNICYYSDRFASEIKYMIKNIAEGLTPADEHLLLNTLSTISNLLRHGDTHLPTLIETGTLSKVVELYSKASNADQVNYFNNLMKKAVAFSEFQKHFDKKRLKQILECHIASGLVRP